MLRSAIVATVIALSCVGIPQKADAQSRGFSGRGGFERFDNHRFFDRGRFDHNRFFFRDRFFFNFGFGGYPYYPYYPYYPVYYPYYPYYPYPAPVAVYP